MIDVAAVSMALRQNKRNSLNKQVKARGNRPLLFAATALTLLAGGWFSIHHMTDFAFTMGVVVFLGMLGVAIFGQFLTPGFSLLPRTAQKRMTGGAAAHHPITESIP